MLSERLGPREVVTAVAFDLPADGSWFYTKAMRRPLNSASIVTVAAAVTVQDGSVGNARIALGGAGEWPLRAKAAEAALTGKPLDRPLSSRPPRPRCRMHTRSTTPTPAPGIAAASCPSTSVAPCWASEREELGMPSTVIELVVNGEPQEFLAPPGSTLLSSLRDSLQLTAAKRGCSQGRAAAARACSTARL